MHPQHIFRFSTILSKRLPFTANRVVAITRNNSTLCHLPNKLILNFETTCSGYITLRRISSIETNPLRKAYPQNDTIFERILNKLTFKSIHKARLNAAGYILYESIADRINYLEFFEEFSLPDTFYSWFVVTELHIWMLTVRCMAEGEDGRLVRNRIVHALWGDVAVRVKQLGASNPAGMRHQVGQLSEQFQAALIAYDEGLQSDDVVLAGAIWRRMYQQCDVDPENLDLLVKYIRKHVRLLDSISRDQLFSQKMISWESIND